MPEMPTWEGFMIPVLTVLSDGATRRRGEMSDLAADVVGLSDEQRKIVLSSGQSMHANRVGWALSQLARVEALSRPSRGHYAIAEGGRQVLAAFPDGVTEAALDRLGKDPGSAIKPYVPSRARAATGPGPVPIPPSTPLDPTEQIAEGLERITEAVSKELVSRLLANSPAFFERTVVDLLVAMGYGGTGGKAAATQLVNDGGIDGVIDQDVLGLDKVYVQAKRYAPGNAVGRPELQGFVGALSGKADGGVFITTSTFSKSAVDYARYDTKARIILIDSERLTELMIRYGVGVQVKQTVRIVEIDEDFFE